MGRAGGRALRPPFAPMEALSVDEIPTGSGWLYEPKWDGFRCLVFRNRRKVVLQSKAGRPLTRYFPDLIEAALNLKAERFVLDGEIVVPQNGTFSFDDLLQRIHPASSRVQKLAAETPALLIVFDLLADTDGRPLIDLSLHERRRKLEAFARQYLRNKRRIRLSPATTKLSEAKAWLNDVGAMLDGASATRSALDYPSGERTGNDGTPIAPDNGNRSSRSSWSKFDTTIFPDTAFATEQNSCAGGPISRRGSAPWTRSCKRK